MLIKLLKRREIFVTVNRLCFYSVYVLSNILKVRIYLNIYVVGRKAFG